MPYEELWPIRITSGTTSKGQKFTITDNWRRESGVSELSESWTGTTSFYSTKFGKLGKQLMSMDSNIDKDLASMNCKEMNIEGEIYVGAIVDVDGHGRGKVTGLNCCGRSNMAEVMYEDGTSYHVPMDGSIKMAGTSTDEKELIKQKGRWADA